jgi:DNA-binding transcriptional LysR family regulator
MSAAAARHLSPPLTAITDRLGELRLGDLSTFLAVQRSGSITGAARELRVTPSQVSKAITRLEAALRLQLLSRSSRGVALSETGRRVLPHIEAAVSRLLLIGRSDTKAIPELTVAAPSWLLGQFLPTIAACQSELRVRGIELPPPLVRAYAAENFFDLCLLPTGTERLPSTWVSVCVGQLRKTLFASPALANHLGPQPVAVDRLRPVPFVIPIYNADGQFLSVDDDCPLAVSERVVGHQAQTIGLALELAAQTDQLVFGPVIAARRHLSAGTLVEVRVKEWAVRDPLHVACNSDRVLARVQTAVVVALKSTLAEVDPAL